MVNRRSLTFSFLASAGIHGAVLWLPITVPAAQGVILEPLPVTVSIVAAREVEAEIEEPEISRAGLARTASTGARLAEGLPQTAAPNPPREIPAKMTAAHPKTPVSSDLAPSTSATEPEVVAETSAGPDEPEARGASGDDGVADPSSAGSRWSGEFTESDTGREGTRRGRRRHAAGRRALPRPTLAPKPPYPRRSRDLGEEGTVILAILVAKDGRVKRCRVVTSSGYPLLDGSALSTVREKWRFDPARDDGKSIEQWVRLPVEFHIRPD